jgi:uncharacterized repeat protein (TIGR01451 family)
LIEHPTMLPTCLNDLARRAAVWLAALCVVVFAVPAEAAYVQVYSTIQKGKVVFTGNTLNLNSLSVSGQSGAFITTDTSLTVAGYPAGTTMNYALNGSRANLFIPSTARVLYAELIWAGKHSGAAGALPQASATLNNAVSFTTPSGGTYAISPSLATAGSNANFYTRSANVTGLVQLGGSGFYTTANVPALINTSSTDGAGWTLAVVLADSTEVARNLTLFVGAELSGAAAATVSGFCTPVAGPVNGRLLVSAIEGDSGGTGDAMGFGPTAALAGTNSVFGPNNPAGNFFASQINGNTGTLDTSGTFGGANHPLGGNTAAARQAWDITNVDVSAFLTNSQTVAFAQGRTSGDTYAINGLAMQIDVTSPVFPVTVKKVDKATTFVGDTLTYTIDLDNRNGNGGANNVAFFDALPPGLAFVSGSATVDMTPLTAPNPQPASGDLVAGIPIGNVAVGALVRVSFRATVNALPASPAPARFDNSARWNYTYIACGGTVAQSGTVVTAAASTSAARLEPTKTVSPTGQLIGGQTATYTVTVPNTGLIDTTGSTLADPIPAGTSYLAGSTKLNGVAVPDLGGGTMPYATAAAINSSGQAAGVIAQGATATVQFSVVANSGGTVVNQATIDPDGAGPAAAITVSAVNSGLTGPSVAKGFAPSTIAAGGTSTLTITLNNANPSAINGAAFTDNLPGGMLVASPANASTTCVGGSVTAAAGGTTIALAGGQIPASGACTVTANVTVATAGSYTNTIPAGTVASSNAGVNTASSQSLIVTPAPTLSKGFTPTTVSPNQVSTLTITLGNPTAAALTGVSVTDVFPTTAVGAPASMTLFDTTTTNTCGGTLTTQTGAVLAAGSDSVKLAGGSIPAGNVCTFTVRVKAPLGGGYPNTIGAGALTSSGGANNAPAAATLLVASPVVAKSFSPTTVGANTASTLTITLTNTTGTAITALAFTDTYPIGLVNTATAATNTCGGSVTASAVATNPGTLALSAGTLAAGATCTITKTVQSAASGTYTNTLAAGAVTSSIGPNADPASATLNVARPNIDKVFSAVTMPLNGTATLTVTLSNPTATAMTGAAFTDTLPAGLTASAPTGTCVGTKSAAGSAVSLAAGTIPASGSCTVIATVTGTTIGLKTNTIAAGDLTVTGPAGAANGTATSASIAVLQPPTITKTFLTSPILPVSGVSTLQIELFNGNAVALTGPGAGPTFIDVFPTAPGAMTLANTTVANSCSGTVVDNNNAALAVGSTGIRLNGGTIPANGSCVISVNVKASLAGDYVNTIAATPAAGSLTTTNGGGNPTAVSAPLAVRLAAPVVTKTFGAASIVANATTTLTIKLTNPSTMQAITGAALGDVFPAGMKVFTTPSFSSTCGGTVSAGSTANDTSIGISGITVPFNAGGTGSCTVTVAITSTIEAASPGLTNTTAPVTSTNANTSATASASLIVTAPPLTAPTIVKSFSPNTVEPGTPTTLVFTLGSGNTGVLNNANFNDPLAGMTLAATTIGGTCAGTTASPPLTVGGTTVNLTVPNLPPGGCTVTVQVVSATVGTKPNTVSGVTSTQTLTAGAGSGPVNLYVLNKPTIAKAFAPASVAAGMPSTITFTLDNLNASALTNANFTDTLTGMRVASTTIGGTCTGVTHSPALVVGATGSNALNLTVPSLPAGGCTVTVQVTGSVAGSYPNTASGVTTTQSPTAGAASNTATLTLTSAGGAGVQLAGFVYSDANHNLQRDGSEAGTGLVLYAKLVSAGAPAGPALQAVAVNASTGAYAFTGVQPGEYLVVIDDNAALADVTPNVPATWAGTEAPDQTRRNVIVAAVDVDGINLGLFNGNLAGGRVFRDNGSGGGTPNNALQDGSEVGIAGVTVRLTSADGSVVYDTAATDAVGNYKLWIPVAANGASLRVVEVNPSAHRSVGGAPAGSYDRTADAHTVAFTSGSNTPNLNFADVAVETLAVGQQRTAAPGDVVFYAHTFTPGAGGSVAFSATSSAGWPQALLRDANCNGVVDAGEGVVAASIVAAAGAPVCVIVKVTVPAGTAVGAQNIGTLQAVFTLANASPPIVVTLSNDDVTTVGAGAGLALVKAQDNASPLPGSRIGYTITFTNLGSSALGNLRINDATPSYTRFASAACATPLAAGLTGCSVTASPILGASGAIEWTLTGSLAPGASGQVAFFVDVAAGP